MWQRSSHECFGSLLRFGWGGLLRVLRAGMDHVFTEKFEKRAGMIDKSY